MNQKRTYEDENKIIVKNWGASEGIGKANFFANV
jgi:hypothetical protein